MSETKQKKRRGRAGRSIKKWIKRLILLAVVLAAILFGLKAYIKNQAANSDTESSYSQTQVMRGAMSETVYGTGTTSARNQPNVLAEADGTPFTAHTTSPVPLILIDTAYKGATLREGGKLSDVAPTMLKLMGLPQPSEMTGESLV